MRDPKVYVMEPVDSIRSREPAGARLGGDGGELRGSAGRGGNIVYVLYARLRARELSDDVDVPRARIESMSVAASLPRERLMIAAGALGPRIQIFAPTAERARFARCANWRGRA